MITEPNRHRLTRRHHGTDQQAGPRGAPVDQFRRVRSDPLRVVIPDRPALPGRIKQLDLIERSYDCKVALPRRVLVALIHDGKSAVQSSTDHQDPI